MQRISALTGDWNMQKQLKKWVVYGDMVFDTESIKKNFCVFLLICISATINTDRSRRSYSC